MQTMDDLISYHENRIKSEINRLQQQKFSTHEEITNKDRQVSECQTQLNRVTSAKFPLHNGLQPICPGCYITSNHQIPCNPTTPAPEHRNIDFYKCPQCKEEFCL